MFKIFGCKTFLEEGIPLIIVAIKRIKHTDCLDGFVLIDRLSPKLEPILLVQRANYNYLMSEKLLEDDFQAPQLLDLQLSRSKRQLSEWLYEQRKGTYVLEQDLRWEEQEAKKIIVSLVLMFNSDKRVLEKAIIIRESTTCDELRSFLNDVLALKVKIEKVDEGEK